MDAKDGPGDRKGDWKTEEEDWSLADGVLKLNDGWMKF